MMNNTIASLFRILSQDVIFQHCMCIFLYNFLLILLKFLYKFFSIEEDKVNVILIRLITLVRIDYRRGTGSEFLHVSTGTEGILE